MKNKIYRIVKNVTFRRIITIFIIGLVLRIIVNNVYNLNFLKEYTNIISLTYYGVMTIYELPKIGISIFDFKLIKTPIKVYCENISLLGNKITCGEMFTKNDDYKVGELDKEKSYLSQDRSKSEKDFDKIVKGKKEWTRETWENKDIDKLEELHKERERKRERKYRKLGLRLTSDTLSSSERLEVQRARKDYLNFDQNSLIDLNSSKDQNKLREGRVINKEYDFHQERERKLSSKGRNKMVRGNRSVSAGVKGLYGGDLSSRSRPSAGLLGLYNYSEDYRNVTHRKVIPTDGVDRVDRESNRESNRTKKKVSRTIDGSGDNINNRKMGKAISEKVINNINELDEKSIYELDGKAKSTTNLVSESVHELDGRSKTSVRPKTSGIVEQRYIPYRPLYEPQELDGRSISRTIDPFSPDSYSKFNNVESTRTEKSSTVRYERKNENSIVEKRNNELYNLNNQVNNFYSQSNKTESTQLGEIVGSENSYSRRKREYTRGYIDGMVAVAIEQSESKPKVNKKIIGKIKDFILK